MHTEIHLTRGTQDGPVLTFLLNESLKTETIIPAGKMITDSEKMTFVYLIDEDDRYGQLHFGQPVWPLLVEAIKLDREPVVIYQDQKIPLIGFVEELTMLIYNIEGNNNYGEVFSTAVETAFDEILKSTL